jgi:hypothetical protein
MDQSGASRVAGAGVATATTAVAVGLTTWAHFAIPGPAFVVLPIAVALLLGWAYGPEAISTPHPWRFALGLAVMAVLFGELAFIVLGFGQAGAAGSSTLGLLASVALIVPFGFFYMLPVTVPVALFTTAVLRATGRATPPHAALLVGMVVIIVGVTGAGLLALPPLDYSTLTEPVTLTWTVENHSDRDFALGVWNGDVGQITSGQEASWGGFDVPAEACFVSTGHRPIQRDWFVSLDRPENDADLSGARPSPLLTAADAAGDSPSIRVVIAADGSYTAIPSAPAAAESDLVVNLCRQGHP